MKPVLGEIVRLTKSILLHPPAEQKRASAQFIAGKREPFAFLGGIGLSWWYSDDTFYARDSVASLLIRTSREFRDCDPETVSEVVVNTLQEVCADKAAFHVDCVFFAGKPTLFECHAKSVLEFAEYVLKAIEENLRLLVGKRCTIYTVPRFNVSSFQLKDECLHVIAKTDQAAWQLLVDKGYVFDGWEPQRPSLGQPGDRTFTPPAAFDCVLAAEAHGTHKGARFSSTLRFRKILAVLFCIVSERTKERYFRSGASPSQFCIQFAHQTVGDRSITRADCDALVPYFASDIPVRAADAESAIEWYRACSALGEEAQQRIEKGAHFLNRAMNSTDIEAYINYFVTLDALFGQRGSVEASVLAGVKSLGVNPQIEEKTSWLFDLRNELVHGGSRYITEWPQYDRYTKHFRTKPADDIRSLAQVAVLNAPRVLTT